MFPWIRLPLIINAPMSGAATGELAAAVTRAGGLGLIGCDHPQRLEQHLQRARALLNQTGIEPVPGDEAVPEGSGSGSASPLPVGVGVIVLGLPVSSFMPLVARHRPAVVWLSFGSPDDFSRWSEGIRRASPQTQVWVQVGSVSAAVATVQACRPDAVVLQGSDAGGHGHARGSSIVTLLPEVADSLAEQNLLASTQLIAAGGIMDGRGVAAALALGAAGVVMGTRFLGAEETQVPDAYRQEILAASDGGESTARSRVWDEMWSEQGESPWPALYDGRCLRNACSDECEQGLSMEEIRARLYARASRGASGSRYRDTGSLWAGTGVGLVKRVQKAGDIVEQVREQARGVGHLLDRLL
ncbi:hypothetical protein ASPZODRAFT_64710 [Penicilliopsis zonata CBS 506.65]|uniref:Uncharacterized protein n=1 Tax=Penicilliopsis zonata CBS 506.65 TaxID=1073090 RepID=A0A1L9SJI6_9EURO|nr:hypothetical protein ASPZODRAFT_64710 [Penicilliopsis zonata CBS 506.65]OJJ47389.1 hypothetical protein ASPZODRAFT_64710 [Penicilliopsis zonata CBS 506.65]